VEKRNGGGGSSAESGRKKNNDIVDVYPSAQLEVRKGEREAIFKVGQPGQPCYSTRFYTAAKSTGTTELLVGSEQKSTFWARPNSSCPLEV